MPEFQQERNRRLVEPDIVKIDMTLTRDVPRTPVKQKLVGSIASAAVISG